MINLIWDFDGTLFDTYPYMVTAFVKALEENKIESFEIDAYDIYQQMRRFSLDSAIKKASATFKIDSGKLSHDYKLIEKDEVELAKPFANVAEVLKFITTAGGSNYLLTHRDDQAISLLEQAGLKKYFSKIVTKNNHFARKPDPESLNYLINTGNFKRIDTFMIGDRSLDVQAGNNANVNTILFDPDYLLDENNSDLVVRSYDELLKYLKANY